MSRTFILASGARALNIGPDDSLGPRYDQHHEPDPKGDYILMQMLPVVPQRLEYVCSANILREVTKENRPNANANANVQPSVSKEAA